MIKVRVPSAESYKICTRPAVLKSLRQALKYFHLDRQPTKIYFNGEADVVKLYGGEFDDRRGSDHDTDVGYHDKIFVELDIEESEYNDGLDSAEMDSQSVPVMWQDKQTGSYIRPVFNGRKMTITVNKYFKDRVQATRHKDEIRNRLNARAFNTLFDVQTHYPVLVDILGCYKEIYDRLVAANALEQGKDDTFFRWFRNPERSVVPNDILSNLIGNNDVFVFKQELAENGLNFNYLNTARVNKGAYIGQYEVSWSYSFYWNDHTHWDLCYPIQVWQQTMPTEYLPDMFEETKMSYATRTFMEAKLASLVFDYRQNTMLQYTVIPTQDNWRPVPELWISPQLQILVNMEDVDNQVILNIKDIQGFEWNPDFLKWILKFHDKVTTRHENPMQFKVYSDNLQVVDSQIKLTADGDLILTRKPTMGNIYRVTFNLDFALRRFSDDCRDDLIDNPEWADWILDVLFPGYEHDDVNDDYDWWDIHNGIDVGDGEEVEFFERGMCGILLIAHNADDPGYQPKHY